MAAKKQAAKAAVPTPRRGKSRSTGAATPEVGTNTAEALAPADVRAQPEAAPAAPGEQGAPDPGALAAPEAAAEAPSDSDSAVPAAARGGGTFDPALPIDSVTVLSNVRRHFDEEALAELAADVKVNGILQPLLVRTWDDVPEGQYVLVAGERRLRAARLAGLAAVPALIRRMDPKTAARAQILENVHRADLNPIEEAEGYAALIRDHGYKQTQLAEELGVSQPHIANRLRLMKLPEATRDLISRGILPAATALPLVKIAEQYPSVAEAAGKEMVLAKVAASKAEDWVMEWLGSHMQKLEGWDARCCGDHTQCPCRRIVKQFGSKVAVCMDRARFVQIEEEARAAIIARAAVERPQAVAPDPLPPTPGPDDLIPGVRVLRRPPSDGDDENGGGEQAPTTGTTEAEGAADEPPAPDGIASAPEAPIRPEVLDLRMLPGHAYTYLDRVRGGGDAPEACRECPCLRMAKRGPDGDLEWVCIDPQRHQADERRRTRDKNKKAMEALKTERERTEQWAVGRVQESWNADQGAPALGQVDLAYMAAFVLTAAKPEYGPNGKPRANLREYLAGYGVEIENAAAPYHTHQGIAGKLLGLQPQTLWRLCIEWPLIATDRGLGAWYRRKVDAPEGTACDLCEQAHDDLDPFYCRRPDVVPEGVYLLACPKCRDISDLGRLGFYQDPVLGQTPVHITPEQAAAVREADGRDDEAAGEKGQPCSLCAGDFEEAALRRYYNHRWDGAPRGAWLQACWTCREDNTEDESELHGFRPEPPAEGPGEPLTDEQTAVLLAQAADGEIEGHVADEEAPEVPESA